MVGALSDVGLSSAARRFIPEYTERKNFDRLRGIVGSRWLAFTIATGIGVVGALAVTLFAPWPDRFAIVPLYLAQVSASKAPRSRHPWHSSQNP